MKKNSFSYNQGFKKGIEIYRSNKSLGYDSDSASERTMKTCKRYAESGYKNDQALRDTQMDFYCGMSDGLRYGFRQDGIYIKDTDESSFEKRENEHYYGKEEHYYDNYEGLL